MICSRVFRRVGKHESPPVRIKFEKLGVASPRDGRFQLTLALFLAELLVEQIEEKFL